MNHPVILVVPVLMVLDYFLTILGAKMSAGVYRQHFQSPHYELNPVWQQSVTQRRWFNPRHLIAVGLVTAVLFCSDNMPEYPVEALEFILGILMGAFGSVCGRHLTNVLLFAYLNRHPTEITGQVELTHRLVLKLSLFNHLGLLPLLGLLAALVPNGYVIGALCGVLLIGLAHLVWSWIANRRDGKQAK